MRYVSGIAVVVFAVAGIAHAQTAAELLAESDRARGGTDKGITWTVDVETVEDGAANKRAYIVKARGIDAHVETTAPARSKGEVMLFNDRNLWYFKPGLRKPVSISARQKLTGQAANGDIASTNYVRDYDGNVVGTETINGEEAFKLELKARNKNVTYDGIRYWISKKRKVGIKAEFLTLQGAVFKTATFDYGQKLQLNGKSNDFITRMTITDPAQPNSETRIVYGAPRLEEHPESLFNINNIVR